MYSQEMKYENFRLVKVRCLIDLLLKRGVRRLAGRRQTGDLFLNLASSAGFPADFPLDAADFANFPGTADKLDKIFSKICSAA